MSRTTAENELKTRYDVTDQGFAYPHLEPEPRNLLSLPEFGAWTDPYEYEIWIDGPYLHHKDIGGCSAIIVSHGTLGGLVDILSEGVNPCTSCIEGELHRIFLL